MVKNKVLGIIDFPLSPSPCKMNKNCGNLRTYFPRWFAVLYTFCGICTLLFFAVYIIWLINKGLLGSDIFSFLIFLIAIISGLWVFSSLLFYSVAATDKGLITNNLFGESKSVLWDEIVEVRRPRFRIPADFTYVLTTKKKKILLVRSMKNYKALIQLIKERSGNLQSCKS